MPVPTGEFGFHNACDSGVCLYYICEMFSCKLAVLSREASLYPREFRAVIGADVLSAAEELQ